MGCEALGLLRAAFEQGVTFRIGSSTTTGAQNTVVWYAPRTRAAVQPRGGPLEADPSRPSPRDRRRLEIAALRSHLRRTVARRLCPCLTPPDDRPRLTADHT